MQLPQAAAQSWQNSAGTQADNTQKLLISAQPPAIKIDFRHSAQEKVVLC
jgi:hypothetical protein